MVYKQHIALTWLLLEMQLEHRPNSVRRSRNQSESVLPQHTTIHHNQQQSAAVSTFCNPVIQLRNDCSLRFSCVFPPLFELCEQNSKSGKQANQKADTFACTCMYSWWNCTGDLTQWDPSPTVDVIRFSLEPLDLNLPFVSFLQTQLDHLKRQEGGWWIRMQRGRMQRGRMQAGRRNAAGQNADGTLFGIESKSFTL